MNHFLTLFEIIGILSHRRYQKAEQSLSAIGLNHTDALLLSILQQKNGPITQDELSNFNFVDRSNVGRALKRLAEKNYISRTPSQYDKRTNLVEITKDGYKVFTQAQIIKNQIAQELFLDLEEDDAGTIVKLLKKALTDEEYQMRSKIPEPSSSKSKSLK